MHSREVLAKPTILSLPPPTKDELLSLPDTFPSTNLTHRYSCADADVKGYIWCGKGNNAVFYEVFKEGHICGLGGTTRGTLDEAQERVLDLMTQAYNGIIGGVH